jgi:hypothetical protein
MYLQVCGGEEKGGNTCARLAGPGHGEAMGEGAGA